jgi:hypothetical protein
MYAGNMDSYELLEWADAKEKRGADGIPHLCGSVRNQSVYPIQLPLIFISIIFSIYFPALQLSRPARAACLESLATNTHHNSTQLFKLFSYATTTRPTALFIRVL